MVIIVDASAVIAAVDRKEPKHDVAAAALRSATLPLIIPSPVTAEIDYLLGVRLGRAARLAFLNDIAVGNFRVECLEPGDYATVLELEQRYAALNPGLADLSIVVLAARFNTRTILTFDERHFRVCEPLQGGRFTILPTDADSSV
ncbi:MAG: VapC toxin family PIN domain ribonuclease [Anaerolinea sp.]|nr:VapC toxin family PIN domain ribonuclease [Anaerolinea sp.]